MSIIEKIGGFITLPIVQVAFGAVIGAGVSILTNLLQLQHQRKTAAIGWVTTYATKIEDLLKEFDTTASALDAVDQEFKASAIDQFERVSLLYHKNIVLLAPPWREYLNPRINRARLALMLLKANKRDRAKDETIARFMDEETAKVMRSLSDLQDPNLGAILLSFTTEYRSALVSTHDAAVSDLQQGLALSRVLNVKDS